MIRNDDLQTGKEFKDLLQKQVSVSEVLIYGSRARGDADPDSDLDILVVIYDEETGSREKVYDAAWETGLKRKVVISTIVVTRREITQTALRSSPLIQSVRREGIAV